MLKGLFIVWLLLAAGGAQAVQPQPVELIRSTADHVLEQVRERKAELEKNSGGIYALVKGEVLPHFDFRIMSRGALGKHWRKATDKQKAELAQEFQELLVRTYATMLLNYADQEIEYLPFRGKPGDKRVTVSTRVHNGGAPPVPINYRLYRQDTGAWKIYDVVVNGVSLVSSYRGNFSAEVQKGGIDGLIGSLQTHNQKLRGA